MPDEGLEHSGVKGQESLIDFIDAAGQPGFHPLSTLSLDHPRAGLEVHFLNFRFRLFSSGIGKYAVHSLA